MKICFLLFFAVRMSCAVKRSDFRTCADSGFCTRHRKTTAGETTFFADISRFNESSRSVYEFPLKQDRDEDELLVQVSCLADSTFRLRISELNPQMRRYSPTEALKAPDLEVGRCVLAEKSHSKIVLKSHGASLEVTVSPFAIHIFHDDRAVLAFNCDGYLKYETFKAAHNIAGAELNVPENGTDVMKDEKDEIEDANVSESCEERFNNRVDKNPLCHQSVGADITFFNTEHVFGIPEHADSFALKSTRNSDPYRLYNTDVFEYELHNPMALYGAVPYMISHSSEQTSGLFWLNSAETWVDIHSTKDEPTIRYMMRRIKNYFKKSDDDAPAKAKQVRTRWMSETGDIDVFFMLGPSPNDVFRQYARLTGTTTLPPIFSLGFHQSRWNYFTQQEVLSLLDTFESYDLPVDAIWLDIEYTDGCRYFTWNVDKFPDPVQMTKKLVALRRKLVIIVDPHIKVDGSYSIYQQVRQNNFTIKQNDGHSDYEGNCWPGRSVYIDFLNPDARRWYEGMFALEKFPGTTLDTHLWNDMNEPSVFSEPEITSPKDAIHFGGWENRAVHNVYGLLQHLSTVRGMVQRSNGTLRPFVLSRSFFAGSQRAGAVWTGDNTNDWGHLKMSIPMLLSLSVTGLSFCGADVGGFFDSSKETELFVRWYQLGAMLPFYRVHSHLESIRREPWELGADSMKLITQALSLRYSMLPLWYTLFYENELTGSPPMRPLWSEFPSDSAVIDAETSYMIGNQMLVSPVLEPRTSKMNIYLPGLYEVWYDAEFLQYDGGEVHSTEIHPDSIPRFQRGGTVIPLKERKRRSAQAMVFDPYTVSIALDKRLEAKGSLFMDDGHSFLYQKQMYYYREITMVNNTITSRLLSGRRDFRTREWIERIRIAGFPSKPSQIQLFAEKETDSVIRTTVEPLSYEYYVDKRLLVVRRPGVNANSDWKIQISL